MNPAINLVAVTRDSMPPSPQSAIPSVCLAPAKRSVLLALFEPIPEITNLYRALAMAELLDAELQVVHVAATSCRRSCRTRWLSTRN
jgi:hypothetical protein